MVGRLAWDLKAGDDRLLEEARPMFEEAERRQEGELLERVEDLLRYDPDDADTSPGTTEAPPAARDSGDPVA